jgi:hypothetical protein
MSILMEKYKEGMIVGHFVEYTTIEGHNAIKPSIVKC